MAGMISCTSMVRTPLESGSFRRSKVGGGGEGDGRNGGACSGLTN